MSIDMRLPGAISYHHPRAFWFGVSAVTAGVGLHLPMFLGAASMHYRLVGMKPDTPMLIGMSLIVLGLLATAYGLLPPRGEVSPTAGASIMVGPLDDAKLTPAHVGLLIVMAIAVTVDALKPITLSFVLPGFAKEYGLGSVLNPKGHPQAAVLALAGIGGTVIGSFLWGYLGDRIGRRASILLASVIFIATSICGAMPSYEWNLVMCFVMGLGVGGMLPLIFALVAETVPRRHRGWLMVLIGGNIATAYIIVSWLSTALASYTWRALWFIGLPTGVLLIALNRWIPESPRFLIAHGREAEAGVVMRRFGVQPIAVKLPKLAIEEASHGRWAQLFARPLLGSTVLLSVLGAGVGLVSYGFQLWMPTNLQKLGFTAASSSSILRDSALIGLPVTFVVAMLYGFWSSRKTMMLMASLTAAALVAFVLGGSGLAGHRVLLYLLLVLPITGISAVLGALCAYGAEVYPTKVRSRSTGLAAGATKAGGVLIIVLVVAKVAPPSIAITALIGAVPMALGAVALATLGIETRARTLEDITAQTRPTAVEIPIVEVPIAEVPIAEVPLAAGSR
jgi:MFS transporter, putative metabolite:H+ symporter